jgi:two-component system, NarL family, nitrate/nitrite response regulator NarL
MNSDDLFEAIRLGARGVVLKDMAPRLLMQCVRTVHAGGKWLEKGVATSAVDKLLEREAGTRAVAETLTPRELQVARMIAKGVPSKTVASRLAITEGTAKLHLHHVYEKLKVEGRVGLMRFMHSRGLD